MFLLYLSVHWGDLIQQIKKSVIYTLTNIIRKERNNLNNNGNTNYVLIHYVQTKVNYLPLKYPQNQVQQSMGGSHEDPNTFITFFF